MRPPAVFGQYVPVASAVHRLDARTKMVLAFALTVELFTIGTFTGLALSAALVAGAVALSRVPPRLALRGLSAVSVVLALTLALQAIRAGHVADALVTLGPIAVSASGIRTGVFFVVRIALLVVGTSLVTLTTSPVALTDGLERLMRPLAVVRFPVHDLAMMLTVALRFIPTTAVEAEAVIVAQTARGARFDSGGPIVRARAYVPVLVPLFVNLFRRADSLASAMEARCYRGGSGRTRLTEPVMRPTDWIAAVAGAAMLIGVGVWL
jgi:energy-coupling factor transport system permease protein